MFDRMTIESKFLTGMISKILVKAIKKQTGFDVIIQLNKVGFATNQDGTISVNLDVNGTMNQKDFEKLLH